MPACPAAFGPYALSCDEFGHLRACVPPWTVWEGYCQPRSFFFYLFRDVVYVTLMLVSIWRLAMEISKHLRDSDPTSSSTFAAVFRRSTAVAQPK